MTWVMSTTKYFAVTTTVAAVEQAETIAKALIEQRLAACVQISAPITSVYRWEGRVETSSEHKLTAKTTAGAYEQLERIIRQLHPYDTPEILAVPIVAGHTPYLAWMEMEVAS